VPGLATLKSYKASFLPHDHRTDAVPVPGLLVYRFSAPLFFANCSLFRDRIEALIDTAPQPVRGVVVDGGAIPMST
jgi:MFS superfamily sulfate permease-like transporter